ncbi:hypothetical protein HZC20_00895 [Candidatus Peregrinibacteria bacterium]|nr:hypothetical protein [Candidatus Peregrinibacteria bacterium]
MVTATSKEGNIIDARQYRAYKEKIKDTESADKMKDLLEEIQELPSKKQEAAQKDAEESKELDPNSPELIRFQKEFNSICDKNSHLIGEGELDGFKAWFSEEIKNTPTIKHAKELIKRLEGKEIRDKGGLAPRREEYQKLEKLFQKYGIKDPQESEWIKREGFSERQSFRKNAEEMEDHLREQKDTGFYSKEVIQEIMGDMLMAKSPVDQKRMLVLAKNTARMESESFTHLDARITVGGKNIRKLSAKGKKQLIDYYKTLSMDKREENVRKWPKFIEEEGKLAKELEDIYKDNPDELKLALDSFETMDFEEKKAALKMHGELVKETTDKTEREKTLTIEAAHAKIDEAARENIIAKGADKTQGRYKKFFDTESKFKDKKTGKPGSLEELKKAYETLISDTPSEKYKNLKGYEVRRDKYNANLKKLEEMDPTLKDKDIDEWQGKYDSEGWSKRTEINEELKREIEKARIERKTERDMEKKSGLTKAEKEKAKREKPELTATIESVTELLQDDQGAEAMKALLKYNESDPDNPKILFWMKTVAEYMKEFGSDKKLEENMEAKIDEELEDMMSSDATLKEDLEEQNLMNLNLQGAKLSEHLHDKNKSAQERSEEESLDRVDAGSLEAELTEDYYAQTDDSHVLNKEKTGEEIVEIQFDEMDMDKEERTDVKEKTYKKQTRLTTKEGFAHTSLLDKHGKEISAEQAEKVEQKGDLEEIEDDMTDKVKNKINTKTGHLGVNIFDINSEIAAKRKARAIIDKEIEKKIEHAA